MIVPPVTDLMRLYEPEIDGLRALPSGRIDVPLAASRALAQWVRDVEGPLFDVSRGTAVVPVHPPPNAIGS